MMWESKQAVGKSQQSCKRRFATPLSSSFVVSCSFTAHIIAKFPPTDSQDLQSRRFFLPHIRAFSGAVVAHEIAQVMKRISSWLPDKEAAKQGWALLETLTHKLALTQLW